MPKIKRWRGNIIRAKTLIESDQNNPAYSNARYYRGISYKKGQFLDTWDVNRIEDMIKTENPGISDSKVADIGKDIIETVPNYYWKTTMKFESYTHTNSGYRIVGTDVSDGCEYEFSWKDWWALFPMIENAEVEGVFTFKKHGAYVTARMILDDDEKQAIQDGTW